MVILVIYEVYMSATEECVFEFKLTVHVCTAGEHHCVQPNKDNIMSTYVLFLSHAGVKALGMACQSTT